MVDRRTGETIGRVTACRTTAAAPDCWMVGESADSLRAQAICVEIDPARKRIAVELPEGLKDLNRP